MADYVKKTFTGYKVTQGGYSDEETTHVIMTIEEYEEQRQEIRSLRRQVEDARQDAKNREKKAWSNAQAELDKHIENNNRKTADKEKEAGRRISAAENRAKAAAAEVEEWKEEAQRQEYKNRNLLRIMKERANAKRGLEPKKQNNGYAVLSSEQFDYKYKPDGEKVMQTAKVWKTVLQSPYDATIPIAQVRNDIEDDLRQRVLGPMRFKRMNNGEYQTCTYTDDDGQEREGNMLFKWSYKANYKSGFWELSLYHTKSIIVPKEMRP